MDKRLKEFENDLYNIWDVLLEAVWKCEKIEKSGQLEEGGNLEYLVYVLKKDIMRVESDLIMICDALKKAEGDE